MTTRMFQGVPLAMQQDGWWLDAPVSRFAPRTRQRQKDVSKAVLLVLLIALGDVLAWDVMPGLSFALLLGAIALCGLGLAWPRLSRRARVGIAAGSVLSVLPLIELVQPLSVLIAFAGLSLVGAALAGLRFFDLGRGGLRLWWIGPMQSAKDSAKAVRRLGQINTKSFDLRGLVMGWALPIAATLVFGLLIAGANPVLDRALSQLGDVQLPVPNIWRVWFWLFLGVAIWPVLVAVRLRERLGARKPVRITVYRPGVINAGSVARSLIAFNVLFAVQTGMDVLFLYGGAGLPKGVTAADYAHRGAYPLLITALLAGLFAMLARPHLAGRPAVRVLMLVWLAQTMALVVASVWRLDTYVDIYGLTRLRVAAYIWMGLVAAGLGLVVLQVWQNLPARWMLLRAGAMGAATLYVCAFVNIDYAIATHNLTRSVKQDTDALCRLSEGVLPALAKHWRTDPVIKCESAHHFDLKLFQPTDWREWGFRNWRVRRSLAAMTQQTQTP